MRIKVEVEVPNGEYCNPDVNFPCRFLKSEAKLGTYGFGNTKFTQAFKCRLHEKKIRRTSEYRVSKCQECVVACNMARAPQNAAGGLSGGK